MLPPDKTEVDNIYEVRFKNTRKGFYRNVHGLQLYIGDKVVVESDRGYDVGTLSLGGIAAELQMRKKGFKKSPEEIARIFRKANENDLELLKNVREREGPTRARTREIIEELRLDMKLSDVEFQADNAKAIFYYIADHRVDFRELIKILAREFRIRVEMKQIGLRHEAGLVGGIGSCGRELCCSTWLTEFKTVSTSAARYQNLSLNPMKISGLCGRLKCCLNYELEAYMDALKDFPKVEKLRTAKGVMTLQKTDIFKGRMWFAYPQETSWYPLSIEEVRNIMAMNEKGETPESPQLQSLADNGMNDDGIDFVDVVGQLPHLPAEPRQKRGRRSQSKKKRNTSRKNRQGRKGNTPRNQEGNTGQQKNQQSAGKDGSGNRRNSSRSQRRRGNPRHRNNKNPGNDQAGKPGKES